MATTTWTTTDRARFRVVIGFQDTFPDSADELKVTDTASVIWDSTVNAQLKANVGVIPVASLSPVNPDRLIGRDTAGSGPAEELTVGGGLEFTGTGGIQRSALTSDITAPAGSGVTTIANDAVTYAKMQNVSAISRLLGRGDSGAPGDPEEIILGTNLSMAGTTLNATGGGAGTPEPWTTVVLGADYTNSTTTQTDVGLAFTPAANKSYQVEVFLLTRTVATTTGLQPIVVWPTGLTDGSGFFAGQNTGKGQNNVMWQGITTTTQLPQGGLENTTESWQLRGTFHMVVGGAPSGTFKIQCASEVAASQITIKAGSYLTYREIAAGSATTQAMSTGTATIDFGAFPGVSDTSVVVTGQAGIVTTSNVQAWLYPTATADHTADEHLLETIRIMAGNIVAATGFTIYGINTSQLNEVPLGFQFSGQSRAGQAGMGTRIYGQWTVKWRWS